MTLNRVVFLFVFLTLNSFAKPQIEAPEPIPIQSISSDNIQDISNHLSAIESTLNETAQNRSYTRSQKKQIKKVSLEIKDALSLAQKALVSHTELTTYHPDVLKLATQVQKLQDYEPILSSVNPAWLNSFEQALAKVAEDMAIETSLLTRRASMRARWLSLEDLEKQINDPKLSVFTKNVYRQEFSYRKAASRHKLEYEEDAKTLPTKDLETIMSYIKTPKQSIRFQIYQAELKRRKEAGWVSTMESCPLPPKVAGDDLNVEKVIQKMNPCGDQINLDDKLQNLDSLNLTAKSVGPFPNFPEMKGPSFVEDAKLIKESLLYLKNIFKGPPFCLETHQYSDQIGIFQAARRAHFETYTPFDIHALLVHIDLHKDRWMKESAEKKSPISHLLDPWPADPVPVVVVKPDGRLMVLFKQRKIGEGANKKAEGVLAFDLKSSHVASSMGQMVQLTKKTHDDFTLNDDEIKITQYIEKHLPKTGKVVASEVLLLNHLIDGSGNPAIAFFQEYMDSDLTKFFQGDHPDSLKTKLLLDAAEGIESLHQIGLIHGDIKGDNIFIRIGPFGAEAKVGDLGSAFLATTPDPEKGTPAFSPIERLGNLHFVDPETQRRTKVDPEFRAEMNKKMDVASWGRTVFHSLDPSYYVFVSECGTNIDDNECTAKAYRDLEIPVKKKCGESLNHCLAWQAYLAVNPNPTSRPSMSEIVGSLRSAEF